MKFHADCVGCLMGSALKKIDSVTDEARKLEYMRRVCEIVGAANPEYDSAPLVDARIIALRREMLGIEEDYRAVKRRFNALVMGIYDRLKAETEASEDPLRTAIQFSMAGNYIDFGVLKEVDPEQFLRLLDEAAGRSVDADEYAQLQADLAAEGELVFIHDNCGEVALDKLLIETIRARYPGKHVVSIVRGNPILNDATIEDAREVGLADAAEVIENGQRDIAGTQLDMLPEDVRARIERAGVVIAKGQGNFETLIGCGLNVYYLFLSKCPSYTRWFGFERFSGILRNERRMKPLNF